FPRRDLAEGDCRHVLPAENGSSLFGPTSPDRHVFHGRNQKEAVERLPYPERVEGPGGWAGGRGPSSERFSRSSLGGRRTWRAISPALAGRWAVGLRRGVNVRTRD